MSLRKKSTTSAFFSARDQSNQLMGLSWQYALWGPPPPPRIIGAPAPRRRPAAMFFACPPRSASQSGSSVSPSAPQFHEALSSVPSRFPSRFASLCFPLWETRSHRVNPSWQVTELTLSQGGG